MFPLARFAVNICRALLTIRETKDDTVDYPSSGVQQADRYIGEKGLALLRVIVA